MAGYVEYLAFDFQFVGVNQLVQYGVYRDNGAGTHPTTLMNASLRTVLNAGFTGYLTLPPVGSPDLTPVSYYWAAINGSGPLGSIDLYCGGSVGNVSYFVSDASPWPLPADISADVLLGVGFVTELRLRVLGGTHLVDHLPGNLIEIMGAL